MRGTSSTSLHDVLDRARTSFDAETGSLEPVAEQLFAVADAIDSSNQLVRLLSDSGRPADVREHPVRSLFSSRVSSTVLAAVTDVVRSRWSEQPDLLDAIELVGVSALLAQAERENVLEQVEEELFATGRLIEDSGDLNRALGDRRAAPERRAGALDAVLSARVHRLTLALTHRAVQRTGDLAPARRVHGFAEFASRRRQRSMAVVQSARPLDDGQQARLASILTRIYGRAVAMNCTVDPSVIGGLRVQVGDDLYDATVLARLARAKDQLAS